ncbi:MAG: pyridoxamine 5'-phosphate oxidase family protein [Hyphomicrobiaceae bacterium]
MTKVYRATSNKYYSDVAFSESVKRAQERRGSRSLTGERMWQDHWPTETTNNLAKFIASRDRFLPWYGFKLWSTLHPAPWRSKGISARVGSRTLGFVNYAGNRQYITTGNLAENDQARIFLMDYMIHLCVKLKGRITVLENDHTLIERLVPRNDQANPERVYHFTLVGWDVNCQQHIPKKFDQAVVENATQKLLVRIVLLEAKPRELKSVEASGI